MHGTLTGVYIVLYSTREQKYIFSKISAWSFIYAVSIKKTSSSTPATVPGARKTVGQSSVNTEMSTHTSEDQKWQYSFTDVYIVCIYASA